MFFQHYLFMKHSRMQESKLEEMLKDVDLATVDQLNELNRAQATNYGALVLVLVNNGLATKADIDAAEAISARTINSLMDEEKQKAKQKLVSEFGEFQEFLKKSMLG